MKIKEKYKKIVVPGMKKKFGYKNELAVPKIMKVVLNTGIGSLKDTAKKETIEKSFIAIAGQKSKVNLAKKSIASFKSRQGMPIGYSVTLRGQRMYDFLEKMIDVSLPRTRDFKGIDPNILDDSGNLTIGFKEHIVFPEASGEDTRSAFGLGVVVVTNAKSKEESLEMLKLMGFPFTI
jgi:large subunit ribosomal protein L5